MPIRVDTAASLAAVNDEGWSVELMTARVMVTDIFLRNGQEEHAALLKPALDTLSAWLVPAARAHPGHGAGGTIVGELPGRFLLDFTAGEDGSLGDAIAVVDDVTGVDLTLARAEDSDGLDAEDPLVGHTAWLEGTAERDGEVVPFTAALDADEAVVEGVPLVPDAVRLEEGGETSFALRFLVEDPVEGDSLFDGIDFGALFAEAITEDPALERLEIEPGEEAHNRARRRLSSHDHYEAQVRESSDASEEEL